MADTPQALQQDQYNSALVSNACPPGWVNPQPKGRYNLVVIGAGPAGLAAAESAASLGAKVALVEEKLMGGESLHSGSVPSKCLIRSARAYHDVYKSCRFGIRLCDDIDEDFSAVMTHLRQVRSHLSLRDSARRYRERGVDVYLGRGVFTGRNSLAVGGVTLRFSKALVATGSRPIIPAIEGLDRVGYLTNETVFELTRQPRRLAIVGAGPLGCELAQAFCRLGSEVTLIERDSRILPGVDGDAARLVAAALQRDDVRLSPGTIMTHIRAVDAEKMVHLRQDTRLLTLPVDEILLAAGRSPNIEGLNLSAAGVRYDVLRGILVDDGLRTSNHNIYAAGDVCTHHRHTHAADAMARIVLANALLFGRQRFSDLAIPSCTYTDPEIAHVGLTCDQAAQRGIDLDTYTVPLHTIDRAIIDGEETGLLKIHAYKATDRIAGATIVARHASEMIGEITLAMTARVGLRRIARMVHPYPTRSEAIRRAAESCTRALRPARTNRLLARLLTWRR